MMDDKKQSLQGDIIFYTTKEGVTKVEVIFKGDTFWLSQRSLAELYGVDRTVITKHIGNILKAKELDQESVCAEIAHTAADGKTYTSHFYNLDMIIAVGYRVNSKKATEFRIWATQTLREFIIKGFVLDDDRLKLNKRFGPDYFDELLERIREIRASERRFYLKITDIYEQCSIDYSPDAEITRKFFQTVQNKLHWAITGMTAAEIIAKRANSKLPNMGLTTWKNAPEGKILKTDIMVAKNYLQASEIKELERIVTMYLDYAENQASRHIPMKMHDWVKKLDSFLQFNEYEILHDSGKISHNVAQQLAEEVYKKFRVDQDRVFVSDFERAVKNLKGEI